MELDIAFRPVINDFRGLAVEMHLVDWRPHQPMGSSSVGLNSEGRPGSVKRPYIADELPTVTELP